jgi:hypothetical protein
MGDRGSRGLKMALNGIKIMLYITDILGYTEIDDSWGIEV